ncbi:ABC transporter ATP-binding protein [Sporosalibacterium faouarense]|uniref:ABC transporter ATP-binding protein n=1 Tax=Sporosalibacterium faouarense TaxID=516123 RepID=UPI00141D6B5F|nr:ABC transporter ATP-binding protein [Sporosalibacterium faouarense]MTI47495.1 ABC transporter ATP-binding protein [Bacillota bacterium]
MIKRFAAYYKPHLGLFALDMVCAFLIAGMDLVFPVVTKSFINDIIPRGDVRSIYIITGVLVVLYILRYIFQYIVNYWGHVVGTRMEYDMRRDIFTHLQNLPFSFFDKIRTGKIMSRIVSDLREISELAHHGPEDLFISIIMLVGSFIILMTYEWRLTLIVFAFIPIMLIFALRKRKKMSSAFMSVRRKIANVNAQLENSIAGTRVAKSFTNEAYEVDKFNDNNNEFRESREWAFKSMAEFMSGIQFFANLLNLVVISAGGIFVAKGIIDLGTLVAYLLFVNFFLQPIRRLANFMQQFQNGMTGFQRFTEILDVEPDIKDSPNAMDLEDVKGKIEIKNATFRYNEDETVLSNISLTVDEGKTLALVGPSGGGKTTLCHLIPRFYELTEGEICIDGKRLKDITLKSLRKNIGLVQQDVFLFTGTIKDNILYGNIEASDEQVVEAAKNANIHDFIMTLPNGYETYIGEKGIRLSGGQKQRISIARVFLKNPPILILDEATSALDNTTEIIIQKALEKLSEGRTTLVIAHRLSTIRNADEIVVLTDKGVVESGTHDSLMDKDGLYSQLYSAQFRGFIPDAINI